MRTCPSCGFANVDEALRCQLCGRLLARSAQPESSPAAPLPAPPGSPTPPLMAAQMPSAPPPGPQHPLGYPPPGMPPPGMPYPGYPPPGMPYPMMAPVPPPPRPLLTQRQKRRQFLVGLGLGVIPLIVALVGVYLVQFVGGSNSGVGLIAGGALYLAALIAMIVCLSIARVRFIGYGLLAAVVASPVIFAVGCIVILSRPR